MSSKNNNNSEDLNNNIKIILLGDSAVGKTAIINKFDKDIFNQNNPSTYFPNFIEKRMIIDGKKVTINVWDTAGQEKFRSVSKLFVKNAKIVILVYDITCLESFQNLNFWYEFLSNELEQKVVIGLAGNKIDKISDEDFKEEVPDDMAKKCASDWGPSLPYYRRRWIKKV